MIDTTIVVTSKSEERKERKERLPRGIRRRGSSLVAYLTKNDRVTSNQNHAPTWFYSRTSAMRL